MLLEISRRSAGRLSVAGLAALALVLVVGGCGGADREVTANQGDGTAAPPVDEADAPEPHEAVTTSPPASKPEAASAPTSSARGMRWEPAQLGQGSWSGARTSPDGRRLLIVLVGGPAYREDDPCTVAYDADVQESASEVRMTIMSASPPAQGEFGCTSEGHFRSVEVTLAASLGTRRLIEVQFDREQPVFDGARLLEPTWLPDGFVLGTEAAGYPDPEEVRSWQRTWSEAERPPGEDGCAAGASPIVFTQGAASLVDAYPSNGEEPRRTHDVNGATATYYDGGTMGINRLAWTRGGEGYVLASRPSCVGDTPAAEDTLVRIARGLEAARS